MQWVCEICGYVHDDEGKPEMCPVCGAPASKFVERTPEDKSGTNTSSKEDDEDHFEKDLFSNFDE